MKFKVRTSRSLLLIFRFQALVYDVIPPNTVIIGYATGLGEPSANKRFVVGAQI